MRPSPVGSCEARVVAAPLPLRTVVVARLADYATLTKPRIAVLALLTVTAGYVLGSADRFQPAPLVNALLGIALVAAASSAFNQLVERETDGLMRRTENRPLPAGRLTPSEACLFASLSAVVGITWLALFVNATTALLSAATLVLYAGIYTPLKQRTSFSTAIGALPGALPPVLGWAASGAPWDRGAFSLFAILFLWQFPHFLAIAWIYRDDYSRAGLKMLLASGRTPGVTGLLAVAYALALVPISLLPAASGLAGPAFAGVALALSGCYLLAALLFAAQESSGRARRLLWTSLVYLPVLLGALVWDHFRLLS